MTYRVIMSDGAKHEVFASSAASAIEEACWLYRGLKVVACYSGLKQDDVDFLKKVDRDAKPIMGFIDHEVPDHKPIPEGVDRYKKRVVYEDNTKPMFDDSDILAESQRAKDKRT
jgi:hypothetical protein